VAANTSFSLARRKTQVKAIVESEGLKPEAIEQMKKELQLLQGKVVANIEKELKVSSGKGEEERGAVIKEANELIACINADAKRLHGDLAKFVGSAEEMMVYALQHLADVHKGKGEHEKALEKYENALEMYKEELVNSKRSGAPGHGEKGETTLRIIGMLFKTKIAMASVYQEKGEDQRAWCVRLLSY
jgi:tetratricopeptide (TPR) repeat protein